MSFLIAKSATFIPSRTVSLNAGTSREAKRVRTRAHLQHSPDTSMRQDQGERVPAPKRFNKGSIRVSEGALRHLRCHPCRVFSYSYGSETPFHGGNMGSN